jgi:adenylate cyclase
VAALRVKALSERGARLTAGLVMFGFVTCHFISHATGLFGLWGIQAIGHDIVLAPWRTPVGLTVLLSAFLIHVALGLRGLYRRRHLRMPAIEAWQFGLGFTIPLLLAPHVVDARLGVLLYGLEDSYYRVLYLFWVTDPVVNLTRQFALLFVVWIHGCIGLHMWLRFRAGYQRRLPWFAAAALALPTLAVLGVVNAGWDAVLHAAVEPGFATAHGPPAAGSPLAAAGPALALWTLRLQLAYLACLTAVLALRTLRGWCEHRKGRIRIDYRGGRTLIVQRGFSVLEASRWAGVPHVSVCGARGRCSTCRVAVWRGLDEAPPPSPTELATLLSVGAPEGVRLACQLRPIADIGVLPLVIPGRSLKGLTVGLEAGREIVATALFVDLRDSTRLAAGRLPFDAIFVVNRYIDATTAAIIAVGGHITSVAGDGVMSVFGLDGDARSGARAALAAATAIGRAVEGINAELASEIDSPLRFGLGAHTGPSIVGAMGPLDRSSLQFLGDTGNVAARLEGLTKEKGCAAIVSTATWETAGWPEAGGRRERVEIRGRGEIAVVSIPDLNALSGPAED